MQDCSGEVVLKELETSSNLFITGEAGAGKTYLASKWAETTNKNVALTATTGIAAVNLGGETICRFLGIGIAARPFEAGKILGKWEKIKKSTAPWDKQRWRTIQALETIIIDEVSMLRRDQFELIDIVLAGIKEMSIPFGGVQMVLVGDFFQLPPVVDTEHSKLFEDLKEPYCFQSDIWKYGNFKSFNLTTNYRQSDPKFLAMLNELRVGAVSNEVDEILKSRLNAKLKTDLTPVKIFSYKYKVEQENLECLKKLPHDKLLSEAEYTGKSFDVEILKKDCPANSNLYFCEDAQIMMLTNDRDGRWVNGTMGIIKKVNPLTVKLANGTEAEIEPHTWERTTYQIKNNSIIKTVLATMRQYPIKICYCVSTHKSQGITLDFVEVDLSDCFSAGQAYVALSRVKTLEGLKLTGWNKKSVFADDRVLNFYRR